MSRSFRRKRIIYFCLILLCMGVSLLLLVGPLEDAASELSAPVMEKVVKSKTAQEHPRLGGVGNLYLIFFLGLSVYGAHLAARFLSDSAWRRRENYLREVRWSLLDILSLALLFLALAGLYSAFFTDSSSSAEGAETTVRGVVVIAAIYLIVLAFGIWVLRQRGCTFSEAMGLSIRPYRRLILIGAVAFLAFQPFRLIYTTALIWFFHKLGLPIQSHPVLEELLKPDETGLKLSIALSVALSAPLFEEIFFRGFLYQALRKNVGAPAAIVATAALFAAIHEGLFQASLIFSLGVLLAYLMEKAGSIIPCMAVHFLVNGTSLLQALLVGK